VIGEGRSFDNSLEIGEEDASRDDSMGYASLLDEIGEDTAEKQPQADAEGEVNVEDIGLDEIPESNFSVTFAPEEVLSIADTAEELPLLEEEPRGEDTVGEASVVMEPEHGEEAGYESTIEGLFTESVEESSGESSTYLPGEEGKQEDEFSLENLFDSGEEIPDESNKSIREESAPTPIETQKEPEHDFLGLSGLTGAAGGQPDEQPKKTAKKTEVLFEGVEMEFDEQIADVTLAELLLAQGKKKEATDLYIALSKRKGVTRWVEKRLRLLTSNQ